MLTWALSSALLAGIARAAQIDVTVGGPNGNVYTPSNVSAQVGDIISFSFQPKNHTVTESTFQNPCVGLPDGFKTGFQPVAAGAQPIVKTYTVADDKPHWFYCGQTGHCGQGMVFSVNAKEDGPNNFEAFQSLAITINGTASGVTNSTELPPSSTSTGSNASVCPSADNQGRPLNGDTQQAGDFINCDYTGGQLCTYFATGGSFSSGSSDCPRAANTQANNNETPSPSTTAPAAPPTETSSTAEGCPSADNKGRVLESSIVISNDFIQCGYKDGSTCQYFTSGSFSSGSSDCPSSAAPGSSSPSASSASATPAATPAPNQQYSASATCPTADLSGNALGQSGTQGSDFITCDYTNGGLCTYFLNGSFSSGSSSCPTTADTSGSNSGSTPSAPPSSGEPSGNGQCPPKDNNGGDLISSETGGSQIQCSYTAAGTCVYFSNGSFSSGSSTCPSLSSGEKPAGELESGNDDKWSDKGGYKLYDADPAVPHSGKVITVDVGKDGQLVYDPPFVSAELGDVVAFTFHPKNHTVSESTFGEPCKALPGGGFRTGFVPVQSGQTNKNFAVKVISKDPKWFYCGQVGHCQKGMVFAINPKNDSPNSFSAFQEKAKNSKPDQGNSPNNNNGSNGGSGNPAPSQGGKTITVQVGQNGALKYDPPFVSANVGDVVAFVFHPKNHTVSESTFANPCSPIQNGGFRTGFVPVAQGKTNKNFAVKVISKDPKWFYCGQVGHCQKGMVFAINPKNDGPNSFNAFQSKAKSSKSGTKDANALSLDANGNPINSGFLGNLSRGARIGVITGIVAGVLILIGIVLLIIGSIRKSRARKQASAGILGYNASAYRPLDEPAPYAADMSQHAYDSTTPRPSFNNNNVYGSDNGAARFSESSAALYSEHHDAAAPYYDKPSGSPQPPKSGAKYETAWDARP